MEWQNPRLRSCGSFHQRSSITGLILASNPAMAREYKIYHHWPRGLPLNEPSEVINVLTTFLPDSDESPLCPVAQSHLQSAPTQDCSAMHGQKYDNDIFIAQAPTATPRYSFWVSTLNAVISHYIGHSPHYPCIVASQCSGFHAP